MGMPWNDLGEKMLANTILIVTEFDSLCKLVCWSTYSICFTVPCSVPMKQSISHMNVNSMLI